MKKCPAVPYNKKESREDEAKFFWLRKHLDVLRVHYRQEFPNTKKIEFRKYLKLYIEANY